MKSMPTAADIQAAMPRIAPHVWRTPLEYSPALTAHTGAACWLKMECWQTTGSFKIRGALNCMQQLTPSERVAGVVTASAGNHALGVATAATLLHIPVLIVVATDASPTKVAALQRFDPAWVTLRQEGQDYDEAEARGIALAKELGRTFISPYNDTEVIAGQGTIAVEILEELPEVEMLLMPVGGGGLAAGMALWAHHVRPDIQVIGVQSEASPPMVVARRTGKLVPVPILASIADGLAGNIEAGSITFPLCQLELTDVVLVSEGAIKDAMRWLATEHHIIVEGSGAVGVAALLSGAVPVTPAQHVAIVLSGRNITLDQFLRL